MMSYLISLWGRSLETILQPTSRWRLTYFRSSYRELWSCLPLCTYFICTLYFGWWSHINSKFYSCECLRACDHLYRSPIAFLVVCDKLLAHTVQQNGHVGVQIARRQTSGLDVQTYGQRAVSEETTSLQAQKTNCVLLSFPFAVSSAHSCRAGKFWWEVSVWRANMHKDMVIRQCVLVAE